MENVDPSNFSPTYYWDYFQYVLRYVDKHYKNLLNPAEFQFISSFQALTFPAQCLYLRLAGRSVAWFNQASLNYSEIESLDKAMQELKSQGFVGEYDADVYTPALLQVLTKQTCIHALKEISNSKESFKALSKQELVDLLVDTPLAATFTKSDWIKPLQLDLYHFCSFLFFGSKNRDLKEFVVRDLGHRQYVEVDEDDFQPYFTSRKEIEDKWQLSLWREWFYEQQDQLDPGQLKDSLFESIIPMAKDLSDLAVPDYERLLFQVGRFLERQSYLEQSLEVYEQAGSAQALERRVRVLAKLKRVEEATLWAEFGRLNVENPTELHFFQDFLARQASKKQVKQVTG
ncbi:MAG: DNA-directed polymerase, partial [Bacteroidota bacterium]